MKHTNANNLNGEFILEKNFGNKEIDNSDIDEEKRLEKEKAKIKRLLEVQAFLLEIISGWEDKKDE